MRPGWLAQAAFVFAPIPHGRVPHPSAHVAEGWDSTVASRLGFNRHPQTSMSHVILGCTGFWVAQRFSGICLSRFLYEWERHEIISAGRATHSHSLRMSQRRHTRNEARSQSNSIVAGTPRGFLFVLRNLPRRASEFRVELIWRCLLLVYYTVYYVPPPPIPCNAMILQDLLLTTRGVWT
jgi:hypothetical protein